VSQIPTRVRVQVGHWLTTPLCRAYVRRFLLLWIAGKIVNAIMAARVGLPPFGFRFGAEFGMCAFELGALIIIIKRSNDDILLGNLGLTLAEVSAPLVILHFMLSALVALLV
jgi:hypothetical protein